MKKHIHPCLGKTHWFSQIGPSTPYAFALAVALALGNIAAFAQISIPNAGFTYTQDFNTLAASGTSNTAVPAGWAFFEQGRYFFHNTTYGAGDGSSFTYDTYSLGTGTNSDRAFGSLGSVYHPPQDDTLRTTIGVCFTNNTGATITSLTASFTGETWAVNSPNRTDGFQFSYNQNTTAINGAGTWTLFPGLNYYNPGSSTLAGGSVQHSAFITATLSGLNISPGNTFCFRWFDIDAIPSDPLSNMEDAVGMDDFSLSNIVVCSPPVITAPDVTPPTCAIPTGTIVVNATGSGTLEYSVDNGSNWQLSATFSGQAPGNYNIKVRLQANPSCEAAYGSNPVVLNPPFTASTTSDTWTGCVSTDWAVAGNWADGSVPTAADNVTIPNVANDPVIMGSTAAVAKSVLVQAGAVLTVDGTSSLTINGSINVNGVLNAIYSEGTLQNNGQIIIGTSPNTGNYGIWNLGTFNNNGTTSIDNVNSIGLYLYGGTFTNTGDIFIGNTALSAQDCIQNNGGALINTSTGEITLNRAWGNAIWNLSGNVQNSGRINVGSIANTGTGILSYVPFTNSAGAEIHIDRAPNGIFSTNAFTNAGLIRMGENAPLTGSGIVNTGATAVFNNNAGGDISIKQTAVNGVQNDANSTFNNNACATLSIFDNLNNSGTFTNAGLFTVNTTQVHTNSALTNNGIIAYPQGNPIPNVTNNEIIIAATTANNCDAISPAFSLGSPVDFTIQGIFTDAAATMSAGTYVTATNTFTPTARLAEGTYSLFVKIQDGSGGCTRIVSWTLTTQNCCPDLTAAAPLAVVSSQSTCTNCALSGGVIAPPATACPIGSTLQYSTNGGGNWSTTLPTYNQTAAVTVLTRCNCNVDTNISSPTSSVTTAPGTCVTPDAPIISNSNGLALDCNNPSTILSVAAPGNYNWTLNGNPAGNGSSITAGTAGTYMVTNTAANGCTAGSSVMVTFTPDNTQPAFACPANRNVNLNATCQLIVPDLITGLTGTDNCGTVTFTQNPAAGAAVASSHNGTLMVTITANDGNGNSSTCEVTLTGKDVTQPTVQCFNQTIIFNGQTGIALSTNDLVEASDNCGVQNISLSPSIISADRVGQIVPVTVTVTDISGNTATCTSNITVSGFPAGWSQQPGGAGCSGNNNTYNSSTGVWTATSTNCFYGPPYTSDATSFVQRTLCGDGSITAQVTSISGTALGWAGVVMRESNAPGAKKAQLMTNLSSLHRREFRTTTNAAAQLQQSASNNRYWLRIVRAGNQFSMYASANGTTWFLIGAQNIVMSNCIQMGLVATNYTANSTVTATFSGVSYTGSNATAASFELRAASLESPHSFEVYPNPTSGELNLDLTQYTGRSIRIETYSLEGKLLQFSEIEEVQTTVEQLNLRAFPSGMYLVKLKSAGLPDATRRIVLNRN